MSLTETNQRINKMQFITLPVTDNLSYTVKFEDNTFMFTRHYSKETPKVQTLKAFSGKGGTGGTYSIWQAATKKGVLSDLRAVGAKRIASIKISNWMDDQTDKLKNKVVTDEEVKAMLKKMATDAKKVKLT